MNIKAFLSAALLLIGAAQVAASPVLINLVSDGKGGQSASFSITHTTVGEFTDQFLFVSPGLKMVNGQLKTIGYAANNDIDFIDANLNGFSFTFTKLSTQAFFEYKETGDFADHDLVSPFLLTVHGYAGQGLDLSRAINATYSGSLNLTPLQSPAVVPEPASIGLVLAALCGAGFVTRRRAAKNI